MERPAALRSMPFLYYFQIHLRHLLAPFPFWRPLIPLSVALLRCVSFALARMKNSRRILAHLHPEIVLYHIRQGLTRGKFAKNAKSSAVPNAPAGASSFCNNKNQETWECAAKGSRGRPQSPLAAPVGAIPFATNGTKQQKKKGCRSSTDKQHPRLLIPFSPDAESRFSFSPPLFSAGRKDKSRDAAAPP